MVFLQFAGKYEVEMAADFRKIFGLSVEQVGKTVSYNEAFNLILALLQYEKTSLMRFAHTGNHPISLEEELLIAIQNSVIETIQVKKSEQAKKQKMKIQLPKKQVKQKIVSREEAEKAFAIFGKVTPKKEA